MSVEIYKRGAIWHYRGTVAGRRLRGTCGTPDKKIAQRVAAEVEAAGWRRHLDGPGAHVTFAQASIAYRDAGKSERFLAVIEDYWKDTAIREINAGAIRQSAFKLYPNAKGATHNRQVIVPTQAIINFASELEWCAPIKVKRFKIATKTKTPATRAWVNAFADQASADGLPHLAGLAYFMFGTGARRGESCALLWADIDLSAKQAVIHQSKVEDTRTAHMPQAVVVAIANIPSNRKEDEPVFGYASGESVGQVWANVCERAGIAKLTPHSCRHGFATTMLQAGIDPKTVATRGGWKDVTTVMKHYAHAMDDPTVTDVLFDTPLTHAGAITPLTIHKQKENKV
jgi:integrase